MLVSGNWYSYVHLLILTWGHIWNHIHCNAGIRPHCGIEWMREQRGPDAQIRVRTVRQKEGCRNVYHVPKQREWERNMEWRADNSEQITSFRAWTPLSPPPTHTSWKITEVEKDWEGSKHVGVENYSHHKLPQSGVQQSHCWGKKKTQGTLFFFLINGNYGLSYNEISFLYVMLLHLGQSFASSQICWEECSKSAKTSFLHLAFLGIRSINLDNFTFFFFSF